MMGIWLVLLVCFHQFIHLFLHVLAYTLDEVYGPELLMVDKMNFFKSARRMVLILWQ